MKNNQGKIANNKTEDLDEKLTDEEIERLVLEAQHELRHENEDEQSKHPSRRLTKWIIWLIAVTMIIQSFALVLQTYSIPAIEFLKISTKLSKDEQISTYKKSVVTILSDDSKGTGFSISRDGLILTNNHVIDGKGKVRVVFPDGRRFSASIQQKSPAVDLALLKVDGENLPHLQLANNTHFIENDHIYFIGNPLRFHGIANEGTIIDYIPLKNWERNVVMMKAPVYRGNSGSPVINKDGLVIGVVFATLKHDKHGKVGLFVPIDYYYEMISE